MPIITPEARYNKEHRYNIPGVKIKTASIWKIFLVPVEAFFAYSICLLTASAATKQQTVQ